ncbi:MAG: efflux transporter outer membrane subunit [Bdellovibrionota bacterium]
MRSSSSLRILAVLSVAVVGCAVGPDYEEPSLNLPAGFHESPLADPAAPETQNFVRWWEQFDDPVLNALIETGAKSNLDVQLADARVREARGLLSIARSELIPSLNTTTSYTRSRNSKNGAAASTRSPISNDGTGESTVPSSLSTNERDLYDAGFDSEWEIDLFGGKRRAIEAASAGYEAQIEARRDVLVTLLAEIAKNYIMLRSLQHQYDIATRNLAAQRDTAEVQKMRFEAGLASELTVAQAEAQLADTESTIPALVIQIKQAVHRLSVLLGAAPGSLEAELQTPGSVPHGPSDIPPGLPADLLRRRPDVRRAERTLAAATANIGVAVADLFPKLTLTGKVGLRSEDLGNLSEGDSLYWSFGPSLTLPIFAIAAIQANIHVQTARQVEALIGYQQAVLHSLEDVENALTAYREEQNRLLTLARSVDANRRAVELAKELNHAGVVDFLNVLTAQQALYSSEARMAQSEEAASLNSVALYKAIGGGWESFPQAE